MYIIQYPIVISTPASTEEILYSIYCPQLYTSMYMYSMYMYTCLYNIQYPIVISTPGSTEEILYSVYCPQLYTSMYMYMHMYVHGSYPINHIALRGMGYAPIKNLGHLRLFLVGSRAPKRLVVYYVVIIKKGVTHTSY